MLRIDLASDIPAYEQIASGVRAMLVAGSLAAGDALPTVRQLAVDLGVHHNTVAEAYRLLADEGWLELRRGRGARVIERPSPPPPPAALENFARRLDELAVKAISAGLPRAGVADELQHCAARLRRGTTT